MKNLWISLKITLAMCIVLGVGYVLVLRGISAVAGPNGGEADVVTLDGQVVGAANVGQRFTDVRYFWSRPSAVDYNGGGSGGIDPPRLLAGQAYAGDVFPVDHGERNVFQLLQGPQMAFQMGETCLAYHIAHSQNGIEHGVPPNI